MRRTWQPVAFLILATALTVAVCLPWFFLPILGWSIPVPAWSRAGAACLALAATLLLRTVGGYKFRWAIRLALLPSIYFWLTSAEAVKMWGAQHLGPAQLKLAKVNAALSTMGTETISLYEAPLWRNLEPQLGWHLTGVVFLATMLLTLMDGPVRRVCPCCQQEAWADDRFCRACGESLTESAGCPNCGSERDPSDKFCHSCGHEVKES